MRVSVYVCVISMLVLLVVKISRRIAINALARSSVKPLISSMIPIINPEVPYHKLT